MFKNHKVQGFCLTLALFMAGFSDAQALLIDDFENSHQVVPTVDPVSQVSKIAVPSALGGYRLLQQLTGENIIVVDDLPNTNVGALAMSVGGAFGGSCHQQPALGRTLS